MGLEEHHKGYLSPFLFPQKCELLGSSEAPDRVTSKVKWRTECLCLGLGPPSFPPSRGCALPGGAAVL